MLWSEKEFKKLFTNFASSELIYNSFHITSTARARLAVKYLRADSVLYVPSNLGYNAGQNHGGLRGLYGPGYPGGSPIGLFSTTAATTTQR